MTECNVELLQEVMQQIKDDPGHHRQNWWFSKNSCGTSMCFAGWAAYLKGWKPMWLHEQSTEWVTKDGHPIAAVRDVAIKLLGLNEPEARILFAPSNTTEELELMVKDLANGDGLRSSYWENWEEDWEEEVLYEQLSKCLEP